MSIGRNAHLKCEQGHTALMCDWLFNCGAHEYEKGIRKDININNNYYYYCVIPLLLRVFARIL